MKIAVVVRGEINSFEKLGNIWNNVFFKLYPQHEFKIFLHTWKTQRYQPQNSEDTIPDAKFNISELSDEYIHKQIEYIRPAHYSLGRENEVWDTLDRIYETNKNDKLLQALKDQYIDNSGMMYRMRTIANGVFDHSSYPLEQESSKIESILNLRQKINQVFCLGFAAEEMLKYCDNNKWEPDLVLLTRLDAVPVVTEESVFEDILSQIHKIESSPYKVNDNVVLCPRMYCSNNMIWNNDLIFITTFKTSKFIFESKSICEMIFDALTGSNALYKITLRTGMPTNIAMEGLWHDFLFYNVCVAIAENISHRPKWLSRLARNYMLDTIPDDSLILDAREQREIIGKIFDIPDTSIKCNIVNEVSHDELNRLKDILKRN